MCGSKRPALAISIILALVISIILALRRVLTPLLALGSACSGTRGATGQSLSFSAHLLNSRECRSVACILIIRVLLVVLVLVLRQKKKGASKEARVERKASVTPLVQAQHFVRVDTQPCSDFRHGFVVLSLIHLLFLLIVVFLVHFVVVILLSVVLQTALLATLLGAGPHTTVIALIARRGILSAPVPIDPPQRHCPTVLTHQQPIFAHVLAADLLFDPNLAAFRASPSLAHLHLFSTAQFLISIEFPRVLPPVASGVSVDLATLRAREMLLRKLAFLAVPANRLQVVQAHSLPTPSPSFPAARAGAHDRTLSLSGVLAASASRRIIILGSDLAANLPLVKFGSFATYNTAALLEQLTVMPRQHPVLHKIPVVYIHHRPQLAAIRCHHPNVSL
jgi:hypothetical protein